MDEKVTPLTETVECAEHMSSFDKSGSGHGYVGGAYLCQLDLLSWDVDCVCPGKGVSLVYTPERSMDLVEIC